MTTEYPTYAYTEDDARNLLARWVRLDNPDSYPFDHFHAHEYNEMLVFIQGGGHHNINFKQHQVKDNSIHLLAARDLHWLERSMHSRGFAIVYKDQFLHKLQMVHPDIDFHALCAHSRIINLDEAQVQQFQFIFGELMSGQNASAYLLQIIGALITKVAALDHREIAAEKIYDPLITTLIRLLEKHYKTLKTASEYAALLHLSTRTLHNRIRKASGMSLNELLQERVLKEAKKLLVTSAMNVGEIALELGFHETAHFTHWFKKQTGYLPSEYKYGS